MSNFHFHYLLALYISAFACFILGVFVFLKAKEKRLKTLFFLLSLSISVGIFFQGFMTAVSSLGACARLAKIEFLSIIFLGPLYVHFFYILLNIPSRKLIRINYFLSSLFIIILPSALLIQGAKSHQLVRYYFVPGILYTPFAIYFFSQLCWATYKLIQVYKNSTGYKRNQMKYFALGATAGILGGATNFFYEFNIIIPIINPFATYLIPLYPLITTYSILRYRLMDISVVIRRTFIYAIIYGFAVGIFSVLVIFLGQLAFYGKPDSRIIWMCIVSLLVITAIVRPLDNFLTRVTDRILFRKRYEYQKTLQTASLNMTKVKSLPDLLGLITGLLINSVKVEHCAVFLKIKETASFYVAASKGDAIIAQGYKIEVSSSMLITWLTEKREPIVYDEITSRLKREPDLSVKSDLGRLVNEMQGLNAAICIPSFMEDKMIGFILLGEKLSGDMYTQEDLNLFAILSNNAALAIENAQSYEELKDTRDQLLQSERLATIGRFANEVAHEIKNPLQALMTFMEYLPEKYNDREFREKFTKIATTEIERINAVVRQLVGFSKPKPLELAPIDIHQLINSTLLLLENDLRKKGVLLKRDYDKGNVRLEADSDQLKQVFLNLFLNSLEAFDITKSNELIIKTQIAQKDFEITITDTGCGIPPNELTHLFEPFFSTKEKGNGLGLTIVKNIIENHKGRISAESKVGQGTVFHISLPYSP